MSRRSDLKLLPNRYLSFKTGQLPSSQVKLGKKATMTHIAMANQCRRGASTVYKPVEKAVVVATYANHMSFFVNDL